MSTDSSRQDLYERACKEVRDRAYRHSWQGLRDSFYDKEMDVLMVEKKMGYHEAKEIAVPKAEEFADQHADEEADRALRRMKPKLRKRSFGE